MAVHRQHHAEHAGHSHHEPTADLSTNQKRKAIASAVLAAAIAILAVWSDQVSREILLARDETSNLWSYFQQKSLKERIYESELSFAEDLQSSRVSSLRETIARYKEEEAEIQIQAEAKEAEVQVLLTKIHNLEIAEVLLELAIILFSISLVVPVFWLEFLALLAAVGGAASGIYSLL